MGGSSYDFLKIASALTVKVMEIQTSVSPSETWLKDDLEEVYALLSRFFGYGFRLADEKRGLARDPWSLLFDRGEPCDICQHTSSQPLFAGLFVHERR